MNLLINCCCRKESRTLRLAKVLLDRLGPYEEIDPEKEKLCPLNREKLAWRNERIDRRDFSDPFFRIAKQFASADTIVVAAPYWDLSFPSVLKVYLENVYVIGLVTEYDEQGVPHGLCKAKKLYYVTTAGGLYVPKYSYEYLSELVRTDFGIRETELVYAEKLDLRGQDPEAILEDAMEHVRRMEL